MALVFDSYSQRMVRALLVQAAEDRRLCGSVKLVVTCSQIALFKFHETLAPGAKQALDAEVRNNSLLIFHPVGLELLQHIWAKQVCE